MNKQLLLLFVWLLACTTTHAQIITTVAGGGTAGLGDGGQATDAVLERPTGVAVDGLGCLYICDRNSNRVRKVLSDGTIITFAGSGSPIYSGDDGPATAAGLVGPYSIAIDGLNNVYIGDQSSVVRIVTTDGIIKKFAGTGIAGFGGDGGAATVANISGASGIAVDNDRNVYIADLFNNRIRKINTSGTINTIAGTGGTTYNGDNIPATNANLFSPAGIALDNSGNIYVADSRNHRIRKINTSGYITTIAGTGVAGFSGDGMPATSAQLRNPIGIQVNGSGDVYFSDVLNERVRKVSISGNITTVGGNGLSGTDGDGGDPLLATISSPIGICFSNTGGLFLATTDRVRLINGLLSVDLNENRSDCNFRIYPNPNNGHFVVDNSFTKGNVERIIVYDVHGRLIHDIPISTPSYISMITLNVSNGTYVVCSVGKDGFSCTKMIVEK